MSVGVKALFSSALGLVSPWEVDKVELDTTRRRIDFEVRCTAKAMTCPACGVAAQPVHDRLRRSWGHLDFFQFEAWLHTDVPRITCDGCGKTSQVGVPWRRAKARASPLCSKRSLGAMPRSACAPCGGPAALH